MSRFHCTAEGCSCADFVSQAHVDMAAAQTADDEGLPEDGMEMLEHKYHNMTCQARSMYQLVCLCGHDSSSHATRRRESCIAEGEPCVLRVLQGVCFRKPGEDPTTGTIAKTKLANGTPLRSTGRCWRGPSGGFWAELDAAAETKSGWVLIEGPGFDFDGPLLQRGAALTVERARECLASIGSGCRLADSQEDDADPVGVSLRAADTLVSAAEAPLAELGFCAGEEGLRSLLREASAFADDEVMQASLVEIERALGLDHGSVMQLAG